MSSTYAHSCCFFAEIVFRPGTCPAVSVSRMQNDCTSDCSSDDQCPNNEKCCMEGCKKTCMAPQSEQVESDNMGFCPDFPEVTLSDCTPECTDDASCGTNEKCCRYGCSMRCIEQINITQPEVKPDSCPTGLPHPSDNECTVSCRIDNDCPNIQKCCLSGCSMTCRSPLAIFDDRPNIRPGYCPTTVPDEPCKANCTLDSRCPGKQKCCTLGCHKICVDPLTPPHEKRGKCPTPSRRSFTCREDCRFDHTCPGEQKCCQDGCVSTCEDPLPDSPQADGRGGVQRPNGEDEPKQAANERPGTCPKISKSSYACRDHCSEDDDCPTAMKCCHFRCGKRCLNVRLPGVGRDCGRDECTSDDSCPGIKVCQSNGCRKVCLDPPSQSSGSKAGSCPNLPATFRIIQCSSRCKSDDDCDGIRKCCDFGSCKRCLIPSTNSFRAAPRPSKCPDMPATSNLTSCEPMCTSDRACSGDQICCPYGCSTKCQDPVVKTPTVKAGYCPVTPPNVRASTCFKACETDDDCSGNTKCCGNGCNKRCVVPRKKMPRASRPGSCPANDIISPTTNCVSKCSDDYACVENEKCCFNGCRRECVPAVRNVPQKPGFCPASSPVRITNYNHFRAQDCGHYCNSDFSCPGELKCCQQGCKSSCMAKQTLPAPTVKEGFCPATTQSFGDCERRCNSDVSCSGNQKCCFEGSCSQKCVNPTSTPPTPRPGVCPNVPQLPADQCQSSREFCNSDHACPEPLKCCFDGCNNRCINPESSAMSTKEGFCPSFSMNASSVCRVDCTSDDSCPGDQKCCSVGCAVTCVEPNRTPPKDKAGFCPFIPTSLSSSCQQSCQLDDSCPGIMKCCQNGCSRKCYNPVAMPPAVSKAGYCPASTSNLQCDEPCTSDGSCEGNKKCCQLSCGMSCVDPNMDHPGVKLGFCPFVNPNVSTMCLQTCSSDYSCTGDTKCCSFGQCSMRCMAPEPAPQAQRKTGDCPSSQGAQGRPDTIQCISDYACPGTEKCCRIGNDVKCSAPAQDSAMKDGACPTLTNTSPVCIRRCSSDSNCPGNQKCCAAGCSSQCAAPSFSDAPRLNPGHCPYVEPHVLLPCTVNCTADSECGDDKKCCEYGCGMRCLRSQPFPPTTQKDGSCPIQPAVNPLYVVPNGIYWFKTQKTPSRETFGYRNCRNDGQCPGTLKCCASSVGGTECITPV